jgi:hypothetical protein
MIYTLTDQEIWAANDWVERKLRVKETHDIRDKKFDRNNTSQGVSLIGIMGEIAGCRALRTEPNLEVMIGGDDGRDCKAFGLSWQIKTSGLRALIFNSADDFVADAALLVRHLADKHSVADDPTFEIMGGVSRKRFLRTHFLHDYGYGERLVMNADDLTPLVKLLSVVQG